MTSSTNIDLAASLAHAVDKVLRKLTAGRRHNDHEARVRGGIEYASAPRSTLVRPPAWISDFGAGLYDIWNRSCFN